jgi:hypothetical protein
MGFVGMSNGWAYGMINWEQRLRPPMLFTYQQIWLGRILRIAEVERAKRDACVEGLVATWPVMKMDVTKHVNDVAPREVAVDHVQWHAFTSSYVPKYSKALTDAGLGLRVSWETQNLTNWISPVEHGNASAAPRPAAVQCFNCLYTSKPTECPFNFEVMRKCAGASLGSSSTSTDFGMDHGMRCGRIAKSLAKDKLCHLSEKQLLAAPHGCVSERLTRCVVPGKAGWRVSEGALSDLRKKRLELLHTRLRCTVDGRCG